MDPHGITHLNQVWIHRHEREVDAQFVVEGRELAQRLVGCIDLQLGQDLLSVVFGYAGLDVAMFIQNSAEGKDLRRRE